VNAKQRRRYVRANTEAAVAELVFWKLNDMFSPQFIEHASKVLRNEPIDTTLFKAKKFHYVRETLRKYSK
jgi:hypothetical protein